MIKLNIPGRGDFRLAHLVLDLNGTLAHDGHRIDGVAERLRVLRCQLDVHLLTADTFGTVAAIEDQLGFGSRRIRTSVDKRVFLV